MDSIQQFHQFFEACIGTWVTERTYHYLTEQEVERSHTEFVIRPIPAEAKSKVLTDNEYAAVPQVDQLPGFHLAFETVSETGAQVSQALNMLFVYQQPDSLILQGDYLRDRAYEESKPKVAKFRFDPEKRELLMTTTYTHVVSVDSITLINPTLRIRRILNYSRPAEGEPLERVLLVGFGVEQKQ